jgi:hypothetical protein
MLLCLYYPSLLDDKEITDWLATKHIGKKITFAGDVFLIKSKLLQVVELLDDALSWLECDR